MFQVLILTGAVFIAGVLADGSWSPVVCNPKSEVQTMCVSRCQPTCQRPSPPITTALCEVFACVPGCHCAPGYIRDRAGGKCVPVEKCKKYCACRQEFKSCGSSCPPTCSSINSPPTPCTLQCVPGCYCKKGFVADDFSGKCIKPCKCPSNNKGK